MPLKKRAFSLVELLVVVALCAVFLSLLMPSLSQARSHARQAVCAARLQQQGVAMTNYCVNARDTAFPMSSKQSSWWMIRLMPYLGHPGDVSQITNGTTTPYAGGLLNDRFGYTNSPERLTPAFRCPEAQTGSSGLYYLSDYGLNHSLTNVEWTSPSPAQWANRRTFAQIKYPTSHIPLVFDYWLNTAPATWAAYNESTTTSGRIVGHNQRTTVNTLFVDGHVEGLRKFQRTDLFLLDGQIPGWY